MNTWTIIEIETGEPIAARPWNDPYEDPALFPTRAHALYEMERRGLEEDCRVVEVDRGGEICGR
jgi:hypothetical protein